MYDGHCVFVMKQYYRVANREKKVLERVYDCMNSRGFKDPFITMSAKLPAIMAVYKITPIITRMTITDTDRLASAGAQGSSSEDYLFGH